MTHTSLKTLHLSCLILFMGLVSRDLNTHHARITFNQPGTAIPAPKIRLTDRLHAEPTLAIRRIGMAPNPIN